MLRSALFPFAVLAAFAAAPALAKDESASPRVIQVNGTAEVTARPDLAIVSVGVRAEAQTAKEAAAKNAKMMNEVFAALKAAGIADKDAQTSNFSLGPRYEWIQDDKGQGRQKLLGYEAVNTLSIRLRDVNKVGETLDALVSAGANESAGVSFDIENRAPLLDEARKKAAVEARRKAELYAEAAGVKLGALRELSEEAGFTPMPQVSFAKAMAMDGAPAPTPIAPGEQSLSVSVRTVWEIAD